jgi:hypothetical protein
MHKNEWSCTNLCNANEYLYNTRSRGFFGGKTRHIPPRRRQFPPWTWGFVAVRRGSWLFMHGRCIIGRMFMHSSGR